MKAQKMLVIVASVCLLAVFVSGPAYALSPLTEIILSFCEEVAKDAGEAVHELEEAAGDLADCPDEYDNCQGGAVNHDTAYCIDKLFTCIEFAVTDGQQACIAFQKHFADSYTDAMRQARRNGVEDRFMNWIENYGEDCLAPAVEVSSLCAK
jgi:hypothetical protein